MMSTGRYYWYARVYFFRTRCAAYGFRTGWTLWWWVWNVRDTARK